ncbi:MAG: protein kinase [Candidatus Schekmanbacteria bacterium]|nr:protein kinase [Candidatus Schekmanbacteria bacterium]
MSSSPPSQSDRPQRIGRYAIVSRLGRGGMGIVYQAWDPDNSREVAVKVILRANPLTSRRFRREFRVMARLRHPRLVAVFDYGAEAGTPFFVMELVRGVTLEHLIVTGKPVAAVQRGEGGDGGGSSGGGSGWSQLFTGDAEGRAAAETSTGLAVSSSERPTVALAGDAAAVAGRELAVGRAGAPVHERLETFARICDPVAYVHRMNVVHRDLKPANVMITVDSDIKLMDFGLARHMDGDDDLSSEGLAIGTPAYMSPEQVLGRQSDQRSDIYSLGVMLYEMVSGRRPFYTDDTGHVTHHHVYSEPVAPSVWNADVWPALDRVVLVCLAKNPEHRFQTVAELAEEVGELARCWDVFTAPWMGAGDVAAAAVAPPGSPAAAPPPAENLATLEAGATEISAAVGRPARDNFVFEPAISGRDAELARLGELARDLLAGRGGLAIIRGDAGSGKSRLAAEVQYLAGLSSSRVIRSVCPVGGTLPLQVFHAVLDRAAARAHAGDSGIARVLGQQGAVIAQAYPPLARAPELAGAVAPVVLDAGSGKLRLMLALRDLVRACAGAPTVLWVEDLQWADELSIDALELLAGSGTGLRELPLLIVATWRDEADHSTNASALLERLTRATAPVEIALRPLEVASVGALIRSMLGSDEVPARLVERIHEISDGNPFVAAELVRAMVADGALVRSGGVWSRAEPKLAGLDLPLLPAGQVLGIQLPQSVQEVVDRRLAAVGNEAARMLGHASVLGTELDFELFLAVTGADEDGLLDVIDELLRARLVRERRSKADTYVFCNGLVREVLYERLSSRRRRQLHERAGRAIAGGAGAVAAAHRDEVAARHFLLAERPREAFSFLCRAADQARRGLAHADAVALYERAVAVLEADPAALVGVAGFADAEAGRAELFQQLGTLLKDTGKIREAVGIFRRMEAAARAAGREELVGKALVSLAGALAYVGEMDEALRALDEAIGLLGGEEQGADLRRAMYVRAMLLQAQGRFVEAEAGLDRALALARAAGDRRGVGVNLMGKGVVAARTGRTDEAEALQREAIAELDAAGAVLDALHARVNLAVEKLDQGYYGETERLLSDARSAALELGDLRAAGVAQANLAVTAWWTNRPCEAGNRFLSALNELREIGDVSRGHLVACRFAQFLLDRHELERFFDVARALDRSLAAGDRELCAILRAAMGVASALSDEHARCSAHELAAPAHPEPLAGADYNKLWISHYRAELLWLAGREHEALCEAQAAVAASKAANLPELRLRSLYFLVRRATQFPEERRVDLAREAALAVAELATRCGSDLSATFRCREDVQVILGLTACRSEGPTATDTPET